MAKLLWIGIAVVVTLALAKLPLAFLRGIRPPYLLRPSTFARVPIVQRNFFQFPDWDADERERLRKLKEQEEAEMAAEKAAKRRDLLIKAGGAALGLLGLRLVDVSTVANQPKEAAKSTAATAPASEAAKPKPPVAKVELDPKTQNRVQAAQLTAKKAQDAKAKQAEETKKRQERKKKEEEQAAKEKAETARQRQAAKKANDAVVQKKKADLERSKKETDEQIKKAKEEAAKTNPGGPQWGTIVPLTAIAGAAYYFIDPKLKKEPVKKAGTADVAASQKAAAPAAEKKAAAPPAEEKAPAKTTEPAAETEKAAPKVAEKTDEAKTQ